MVLTITEEGQARDVNGLDVRKTCHPHLLFFLGTTDHRVDVTTTPRVRVAAIVARGVDAQRGRSTPRCTFCTSRILDNVGFVRRMSSNNDHNFHPQESIKGVQEEIGALKEGLVVERKKRHNKEVYEEVCKDINKYPPHRVTKVRASSTTSSHTNLTDLSVPFWTLRVFLCYSVVQ